MVGRAAPGGGGAAPRATGGEEAHARPARGAPSRPYSQGCSQPGIQDIFRCKRRFQMSSLR